MSEVSLSRNNSCEKLAILCISSTAPLSRYSLCLSAFPPLSDSTDLVDFMSHNATALPGPPSKPEVTDVTKSSISLSWEQGPEAGSPATSYVIEAFGYVCDLRPRAAFGDPQTSVAVADVGVQSRQDSFKRKIPGGLSLTVLHFVLQEQKKKNVAVFKFDC